jgi:hypothetical protein
VSNFPEHDKIDALRYSNPLATNLAHMLLNGRGWVLENKLTDPPVRLPVARLAAALLGVDADAYRRELDARFGIPTVPPTIADVVADWSAESAVIDEIQALDEEVAARIARAVSDAAAESPIAAAVAAGVPHLVAEGTVLAQPDPAVAPEHRGTLLGAAVSLGMLSNEDASAHPAAGVPLAKEDIFGKPEAPTPDAFNVPAEPDLFTAPELAAPALDVPVIAPALEPAVPALAEEPSWPAPQEAPFIIQRPSDFGQPEPSLDVLTMPAFESGQEFVLPDAAPAPALAQTNWDVPSFGPSQFDDLGVTPPDTEFQFGSYDLDQNGAGDDFNQPLLAASGYDMDAPIAVEGVVEAVGDAELQARRDEALSYLNDTANAVQADEAPESALSDEPVPFPIPETAAVFLPEPTFKPPVAAPAFEDVVAGHAPADEPAAVVEHKNFDLLNIPDGRFPTA